MLTYLEKQIRAWVRQVLGNESGLVELIVVALVMFLLWLRATNRRVIVQ